MKLLKRVNGRWVPQTFGGPSVPTVLQIKACVEKHADAEGVLSGLCVDFAGEYVPVVHVSEARLVGCLLVAYMQSCQGMTSTTTSELVSFPCM